MFDQHKKADPNDEIVGWLVNTLLSCVIIIICYKILTECKNGRQQIALLSVLISLTSLVLQLKFF